MGIREGINTQVGVLSGSAIMSTLFVGNLAWSTTQETLSAKLAQCGTVASCDTGTVRNGRTRGWAIVQMSTAEEAQYAIQTFDSAELDGRKLNVRLDQKQEDSVPRGAAAPGGAANRNQRRRGGDPTLEGKPENSSGLQVVVRNLPWDVTSEMLRGTYEQIGVVKDAQVVCHADSGRSKGWGTVRFEKPECAADAIARFGGVELAGRPMTVMMDRYN